ncbi:MAG: hypothetical protein IJF73_00970 [Clostridia bacterium]|nr:hypothetical protein [Clostridia bacterium]
MIAGYAGHRQAAPLLLEMLERVQYFDGGMATGIATVHEGKLYTVKVLGDVRTLRETTDALNFPGTTGIIHTRPWGDFQSHAHPFTDEAEELAFCENGTYFQVLAPEFAAESERVMGDYLRRGVTIKSAVDRPDDPNYALGYLSLPNGQTYHNAEVYAQTIGEAVRHSPAATLADDLAAATSQALSRFPAELVTLSVHARLPGTVTVGRVTRPMAVGYGKGETYLSTTPIAFPVEVQRGPITFLPAASVSQITPRGLTVTGLGIDGVRVEEPDYRVGAVVRAHLDALLTGRRDAPLSMEEFDSSAWHPAVWREPLIDCRIVSPMGHMKPAVAVVYEALWSFYREGRLGFRNVETPGGTVTKFWLD